MKRNIYYIFLLLIFFVFLGAGCVEIGGTTAGPMGIFKSSNKGDAWVAASVYPTAQGLKSIANLKIYRIFIDPTDTNAMYLATRGQGLYFSYNNGVTWQFAVGTENKFIYALAVDPSDRCTIYMSDGSYIHKTTDCARSWKLVFTEERPTQRLTALAVDSSDSSVVYGAEAGGDILRSKDGGASWRIVKHFGFDVRLLTIDPNRSQRLYVAAYKDGLYRSDDGGDNWTDLSKSFDSFTDGKTFYRLILNPAQKDSLFWISKYGILRSSDAGATWSELKLLTPPGSVNIYSFAVNPKNQNEIFYTGTILGDKNQNVRSTFYRSADGGKNWVTKKLPTNTIPVDMLAHTNFNGTLFMGFTVLDKGTVKN